MALYFKSNNYLTMQSSHVILILYYLIMQSSFMDFMGMEIFMEDAQLMKGILEGCVLELIAQGETYGYEILANLEEYGFEELGEGTLYPVLTRLDKNGYIQCRKAKSPLGPVRKYYSITDRGEEHLVRFRGNYQKITKAASTILFGKKED